MSNCRKIALIVVLPCITMVAWAAAQNKPAPRAKPVDDLTNLRRPEPAGRPPIQDLEMKANPLDRQVLARNVKLVRPRPAREGEADPAIPANFTAGGKEYKFSGRTAAHTSTAVPVAILVVPPFEKVVRSYLFRRDEFHLPDAKIGLIRPGIRSRNVHDDVVPVSIVPEEVYTSFTKGESSSSSSSSSVEMSFGQAIGMSVGGDYGGIGLEVGITVGYEKACGNEKGNAVIQEVAMTGTLSGFNWTLSDLAKIYAIETTYITYEYTANGAPPVTVGVPDQFTSVVFSLDGWNQYVEEINGKAEIIHKLPKFFPAMPWFVGNVDYYPRSAEETMIGLQGSYGMSRPIGVTNQWLKINREGGSLSGTLSLSKEQWSAACSSFGTSTQYTLEATAGPFGFTDQITTAVKQSYTHEIRTGQSYTMGFQTSGVHARLDGGDGSIADFHFKVSPVMQRMVYAPMTDAGQRQGMRRSIALSITRSVIRAGDRLPATVARKLSKVGEEDVTYDSNKGFVVGGYPLIDLASEFGLGSDWTGNVLICQYRVSDLGESYGRLPDYMAPLLLAHRANILRKVTVAALVGGTANAMSQNGPTLAVAWPPQITMVEPEERRLAVWRDEQVAAWKERADYRKESLHEQMTCWVDSRPTLSLQASRLYQQYPASRKQIERLADQFDGMVRDWKKYRLPADVGDQLLAIEPGLYTLDPAILDLERMKLGSPQRIKQVDVELRKLEPAANPRKPVTPR